MQIKGYNLPLVCHPAMSNIADALLIYPHQAEMIDQWNENKSLLLVTKTGSGKTAATVLPIALNRHQINENRVIFVYPTNELIRDQETSIIEWLDKKLSIQTRRITPQDSDFSVDDADIEIVRIDAQILEDFCRVWGLRGRKGKLDKGRALERLLNAPKARIVLINPDILYLVYSLRYSKAPDTVAALQAFQTIVFDEFHLYQGVELAHILYLVHTAQEFDAFQRVVLLSATPNPTVREWIDKLLSPHEITMDTTTQYEQISERRVTHDINLNFLQSGKGSVVVAEQKVLELLLDLKRLRADHSGECEYVPAVVILNSVAKAIDLERQLLDAGLTTQQIIPIRGMSAKSVRKLNPEQLVVIGTSAIEVGIDFQCEYLLFEASDAAAFMQRFGRLGRHMPGKAFLIAGQRECEAIKRLPATVPRDKLERRISDVYPESNARAWFVGTDLGVLTALAQAYNIQRCIDDDRERAVDSVEVKHQIESSLQKMMDLYGEKMGLQKQIKVARQLFKRKPSYVDDYLQVATFRTGLPSILVYDLSEAKRRGEKHAEYSVDVKSLLSRAIDIRPGKDKVFEISGYGDFQQVIVNMGFRSEEGNVGTILTTDDYRNLMLKRGIHLEPCSHVMSRTGQKHIFVFVPYDEVRNSLDWRIPTFPCGSKNGKYVLAFDGDALLLKEIWKRAKSKEFGRGNF